MFPVAILAGGLATRMRPLTETLPKSLLPVAGKPFICHQLSYLAQQNITHVVLCVGYLGDQIQAVVGDGNEFGLTVNYSFDGETLRGTGGALRHALPLLGDNFFVLYGDSYLPIDFAPAQQAFVNSGKPALMTILRNKGAWDKSNVHFENGQLIEYNKQAKLAMQYIDYGLSVFAREVFNTQSEQFDLADLCHDLSLTGRLATFEVQQRFYEIGSLNGLAEIQKFLS